MSTTNDSVKFELLAFSFCFVFLFVLFILLFVGLFLFSWFALCIACCWSAADFNYEMMVRTERTQRQMILRTDTTHGQMTDKMVRTSGRPSPEYCEHEDKWHQKKNCHSDCFPAAHSPSNMTVYPRDRSVRTFFAAILAVISRPVVHIIPKVSTNS